MFFCKYIKNNCVFVDNMLLFIKNIIYKKYMKKTILLLSIIFIMFSCGKEDDTEKQIVKQDYFIQVKNMSDFGSWVTIQKTWKLSSSQDIQLSTQASWRVSNIYVKEWDSVYVWQVLARLIDTNASYWLAVQRAKNALDKAQINYEKTQSSLDKNISDIEINLKNLKIDEQNSTSSLELEKIENSIKKLVLDYENLKVSNISTISGFKNSMWKDLTTLTTFADDVIDFSDKILWVTSQNDDENDSFEDYLWVKDNMQKRETIEYLKDIISFRNGEFLTINFDFEDNSLFDSNIEKMNNMYTKLNILLTNLDIVLDNSLVNVNNFSQTTISTYKSNINWFWSSYNVNNGWFIALKNTITSFLDTYQNNEASMLKQIELLEADKIIYVKSLDVKLEIDESTLQEAKNNKELTLKDLDTMITDARISYKQALENLDKLTIRSPINGSIWNIHTDIGQEVWIQAPLFTLQNNSSNEVVISFSKDELEYIEQWDTVYVDFDDSSYTGSIYSISNIADTNLKYLWRINFDASIPRLWSIVSVNIPFDNKKLLLPINLVETAGNGKWILHMFYQWEIELINVDLWKVYWDKIEILTDIETDMKIIETYIWNYDSEKFILKLK